MDGACTKLDWRTSINASRPRCDDAIYEAPYTGATQPRLDHVRHGTLAFRRSQPSTIVDRPDTIAFGLTARQLLILTVVGLGLYGVWQALLPWVELLILLAATIPIVAATFAIAVGRRDGISFDRWLLAAVRHRRSPRRLIPATRGSDQHRSPAHASGSQSSGSRDQVAAAGVEHDHMNMVAGLAEASF